ncbi:MAG: DUF952 domain-containing protein [Ignavibacteriota bacterium]
MARIFHFISESELVLYLKDRALQPPSLHAEGFIHCSLAEQVIEVAKAIAQVRDPLLLLEIEESKVIPKIIYENLEGGKKLFPHVYGPLNEDAIIAIYPFKWNDPEGYIMPEIKSK